MKPEMVCTIDGRYITQDQREAELHAAKTAQIDAAIDAQALRQAERAKAAADRRAAKDASKALYEYRIAMWARHKAELAALKAANAAAVAAMQARHANEAELVKV